MAITYRSSVFTGIKNYDLLKDVFVNGKYVGVAFRHGEISTQSNRLRHAWKYSALADYERELITLQVGDPGYVGGTFTALKKLIKEYYTD